MIDGLDADEVIFFFFSMASFHFGFFVVFRCP